MVSRHMISFYITIHPKTKLPKLTCACCSFRAKKLKHFEANNMTIWSMMGHLLAICSICFILSYFHTFRNCTTTSSFTFSASIHLRCDLRVRFWWSRAKAPSLDVEISKKHHRYNQLTGLDQIWPSHGNYIRLKHTNSFSHTPGLSKPPIRIDVRISGRFCWQSTNWRSDIVKDYLRDLALSC